MTKRQTMKAKRCLEVVDHDPGWVDLFHEEADRLRGVFWGALGNIHHVGSTSVEGLCAKPTIDILVEVVAGTDIPAFDAAMGPIGYVCRGEGLDAIVPGTPGRFYYVRKDAEVHLVHVHVCAAGHREIDEMLSFRDYLRSHKHEAKRYGELKKQLAGDYRYDNIGYMRGKDSLVKELIFTSLQWRTIGT